MDKLSSVFDKPLERRDPEASLYAFIDQPQLFDITLDENVDGSHYLILHGYGGKGLKRPDILRDMGEYIGNLQLGNISSSHLMIGFPNGQEMEVEHNNCSKLKLQHYEIKVCSVEGTELVEEADAELSKHDLLLEKILRQVYGLKMNLHPEACRVFGDDPALGIFISADSIV